MIVKLTSTIARMFAIPALALTLSVATSLGSTTFAQDMGQMGDMSQMPMDSPMQMSMGDMHMTNVMLPSGNEMISITVMMPMGMMNDTMMAQPTVRQIPGVGYELDYGGPSIRIERVGDE
jgi:hypothetical protein